MTRVWIAGCLAGLAYSAQGGGAQVIPTNAAFHVTVDQPPNGTISVHPAVPAKGMLPGGTVLTVRISPAAGYAIDSGYSTVHGPWSPAYQEFFTRTFHVSVDQDRRIGA